MEQNYTIGHTYYLNLIIFIVLIATMASWQNEEHISTPKCSTVMLEMDLLIPVNKKRVDIPHLSRTLH